MKSDVDELERRRADLEHTLEQSRAAWHEGNGNSSHDNPRRDRRNGRERRSDNNFLRSIRKHPVATAAAVAAIWYVGPARVGALALTAAGTLVRHSRLIAPLTKTINVVRSGR